MSKALNGGKMRHLLMTFACAFAFACGDKDEDTGSDTASAVEDTADSASE